MNASMTSLPSFDVRSIQSPRRLSAWTDKLNEFYYPLDVENPAADFGYGTLASLDIGGVRLGTVDSDPMLCHRRRSHVSQRGGDFYLVPMPLSRPLRLHQRGREALVTPADLAMVGTCDVYTYEQRTRNVSTTLRIPGAMLRDRIPDIDDWTARSFPGQDASVIIFLDFARSFCRHGAKLDTETAVSMANHLLDLLAIALSQPGDAPGDETAVRIAHRQRALRIVDNHIGESDLGPLRVAESMGVSERYLQRIFAERGETLSAIIRGRRIAEARRLLASRHAASRSVASVAYRVGFADPAYFTRVFREQTGMTPADYRKAAMLGAADPQ
jgi:AraC-like DNA-binding protein